MIAGNRETTRVRLSAPAGFDNSSPVYTADIPADIMRRENVSFDIDAARTACMLSLSAGNADMIKADLSALGFGDIVYRENPYTDDSAGFYIASRCADNILHTAVIIKGTEGNEWYSNFDVGYTAEHRGFSAAADFAELSLGDYIFTRAIGTEPRFFITGYSRGGAVAGILAKRLCERYGTDSVRAYTIASPNVTISRRTGRFNCIYNLIRDEDFFTRIPPESWGYSRYGRDIRLKTPDDFAERFKRISGGEYIGFSDTEPTDSFLCAATKLVPNVHAYYKRRRQVGDIKLSLYEFMRTIAGMLSSDMNENTADVFMAAMMSEYADLLDFMSSGADMSELISSSGGIPRCSVADSHSPAAYLAAIEGYRL